MKLAAARKIPPSVRLDSELEPDPVFLTTISKAAGLTQKDLMYEMRVSKTTAHEWASGKKHDFLVRSRDFCAMLRRKNRADLIAASLTFVAGGDDTAILTPAQLEALRVLAKAVK